MLSYGGTSHRQARHKRDQYCGSDCKYYSQVIRNRVMVLLIETVNGMVREQVLRQEMLQSPTNIPGKRQIRDTLTGQ